MRIRLLRQFIREAVSGLERGRWVANNRALQWKLQDARMRGDQETIHSLLAQMDMYDAKIGHQK